MPDPRPARAWPPRALGLDDAAYYVGISRTTFQREVAAGRFPAPIRITDGRNVWLREALDACLDRLAGRVPASVEANPWH